MPAFHPISHLQVSSEEECSLLRQSPFFCLFRILTIAALSWTQLLNVVENLIRSYNESAVEPAKHQYASEQLRVVAQLLDDVSKNITNDQVLVEVQHTEGWPWPEDPHLSQKLEALQRALASDHAYLFAQCARLSDQVTSASRSISQAGQLLQNQRSVQEAREVGRLTTLAFLFLPISFISSVFGMNVAELAGNPPIWVYFAIALPVSFVTFVVASWAGVWEGVKALVRAQRARRLY
jgi:cation transport ATPase